MSVNNEATLKVIEKQIREISDLEVKFRIVGKKLVDSLNSEVDLKLLCANLKKENKQLKEMLQKWTDENTTLQESFDASEREIERLNESREKMQDYILKELPRDSDYFDLIGGGDI